MSEPGLFEAKVNEQVEDLRKNDLRRIEKQITQRRLSWLGRKLSCRAELSPRQAFELLFFEYMGLSREDLPVVQETESEIVWRSLNRCPTLEACGRLGLDTRWVCRRINEKPTQAFLSQIDPRLRFLRSYSEIRPHSAYCLERIVRVDFEERMSNAIAEARLSRQEGNKGYGALVVRGDQILGQAHDTATTQGDPSLHAEVNAIRQAVRTAGETDLSGAVLISTCEPCPMCSSLAVWANVTAIVYGASIEETAALGKSRIRVSAGEIVARSSVMVEVIGGVLREECLALYTTSQAV
ncbi:MAG: nucleoside deaminase [Chloroflexi bacterium]|nr:nucleoside deaminase [Chloroflexota bacterium]